MVTYALTRVVSVCLALRTKLWSKNPKPVLILLVAIVAMAPFSPSYGQVAKLNDLDSARVVDRCTKFLRDIAAYSTVKIESDPDISQAWPRADFYDIFTGQGKRLRRKRDNQVLTDSNYSTRIDRFCKSVKVGFLDNQISCEVSPDANVVTQFIDHVLNDRLWRNPMPDQKSWISEDVAIARAKNYLYLAGIDLSNYWLQYSMIATTTDRPLAGAKEWRFHFCRQWNGIPFSSQHITISLDLKGRIRVMGMVSGLPDPARDTKIMVSGTLATILGQTLLKDKGLDSTRPLSKILTIEQPDNYWTSPKYPADCTERSPVSRLTWQIAYAIGPLDQPSGFQMAIVNVDALTGEIVGGEIVASMSKSRVAAKSAGIAEAVMSSTSITAKLLNSSRILKVIKEPSLQYYGMVSGFVNIKDDGAPFRPTHSVIVTSKLGEQTRFLYDSHSGRIRNNKGQSLIVSPGMRYWLAEPAYKSAATQKK